MSRLGQRERYTGLFRHVGVYAGPTGLYWGSPARAVDCYGDGVRRFPSHVERRTFPVIAVMCAVLVVYVAESMSGGLQVVLLIALGLCTVFYAIRSAMVWSRQYRSHR